MKSSRFILVMVVVNILSFILLKILSSVFGLSVCMLFLLGLVIVLSIM